ncbi:DUF3499 family protein [Egicoccus sp. AB-alg2]|uniref:DUF3499 family protein n=1 Tax=Egicoccus sp. AB-alg2 TaxID=3242693 RepID=UPI00359E36C8
MSGTGELRQGVARDAVVRPLALAADRACSRPSCPAPASATLTFNYAEREAWITRLAEARAPQSYDLCAVHAARTQPPHGWRLRDRRPAEEQGREEPQAHTSFGGPDTVAVLAAALRAVPDLPTPEPVRPVTAASAPSGTDASEPAAPGPVAHPSTSPPGASDEVADATPEDSTSSPVLGASASDAAREPSSETTRVARAKPVLAARARTSPNRGPAADW